MSEADEPFLPVVLAWQGAKDGAWPDAGILLSLSLSLLSPVIYVFELMVSFIIS